MWGVPWWAWGALALLVAVVFAVLPGPSSPATGAWGPIGRWGHSLVWVLLAAAAFTAPRFPAAGQWLALLAGVTYLLYLWTLLQRR